VTFEIDPATFVSFVTDPAGFVPFVTKKRAAVACGPKWSVGA